MMFMVFWGVGGLWGDGVYLFGGLVVGVWVWGCLEERKRILKCFRVMDVKLLSVLGFMWLTLELTSNVLHESLEFNCLHGSFAHINPVSSQVKL